MDYIQGNKLIAVFMGGKFYTDTPTILESHIVSPSGNAIKCIDKLKYHTSWDWQVKVWCKLAHEVKSWLVGKSEFYIEKYFRWVSKYEEAVFNDEPGKGHQVIVEMLEWYYSKLTLINK